MESVDSIFSRIENKQRLLAKLFTALAGTPLVIITIACILPGHLPTAITVLFGAFYFSLLLYTTIGVKKEIEIQKARIENRLNLFRNSRL